MVWCLTDYTLNHRRWHHCKVLRWHRSIAPTMAFWKYWHCSWIVCFLASVISHLRDCLLLPHSTQINRLLPILFPRFSIQYRSCLNSRGATQKGLQRLAKWSTFHWFVYMLSSLIFWQLSSSRYNDARERNRLCIEVSPFVLSGVCIKLLTTKYIL